MIETKGQYERIRDGYLDDFRYAGVAHKDVLETFEALREVAKAANELCAWSDQQDASVMIPLKNVWEGLKALPDWLVE